MIDIFQRQEFGAVVPSSDFCALALSTDTADLFHKMIHVWPPIAQHEHVQHSVVCDMQERDVPLLRKRNAFRFGHGDPSAIFFVAVKLEPFRISFWSIREEKFAAWLRLWLFAYPLLERSDFGSLAVDVDELAVACFALPLVRSPRGFAGGLLAFIE